jgi:hypothetical protein
MPSSSVSCSFASWPEPGGAHSHCRAASDLRDLRFKKIHGHEADDAQGVVNGGGKTVLVGKDHVSSSASPVKRGGSEII